MRQDINILIVDSDPVTASQLEESIHSLGLSLTATTEPGLPIRHLQGYNPEVAILGPSLSLEICLRCIQKLKIVDPLIPVLVFSDEEHFSKGTLSGPFEGVYAVGPGLDIKEMATILEKAIEQRPHADIAPDFPVLIGQSQEIQKIREKIHRIANKDITVLITGESGTGKELIARSIHYHSPRKDGPLLKINCGALPDELLESEVFGFQRGAFTGAHKNKPGRLEMAHGGTLFIDEIGDLSLSLQVKFLQVLEDKTFSRLGGVQDKIVDTRVVAATNTDLWEMVRKGKFRKDLYYRLNVVHIEAPPLRRRREDILLLTDYFLNKYCYEFKKDPLELTPSVISLLQTYQWPGNVRELENLVRRAIVLRDWDFLFKELDLDPSLGGDDAWPMENDSGIFVWGEEQMKRFFQEKDFSLKSITKTYVSEVEKRAILKALKQTRWNRRQAANLLGVSYKTLLNRIAEFGMRR